MGPFRFQRTSQPHGVVAANPLFPRPHLLHFGAFVPVIGPTPTNVSSSTASVISTGNAVSHNGTSHLLFGPGFNSGSFSVLVQFVVANTSGIITLTQSAYSGATAGSQQIRTNTTGIELLNDSTANLIAAAGTITAGRVHTALVSWNNSSGSGFIALNGRVVASASPGVQSWVGDNFVAGRKRNSDTVESGTHSRSILARWPSALPQALGIALTANPWQLFAPQDRSIWVPTGVASTLPTLSAATFVSATSSSMTPQVTATWT